jgi:cation:H+ antiporter
VTGLGVIFYARRRTTGSRMAIDTKVLGLDIRYFYIAYAIAVGAALIPSELLPMRYVAVALLIGIYIWYVRSHFQGESTSEPSNLAPLRLHKVDRPGFQRDPELPRLRVVNLQVLVALAGIIGGAVIFVDGVEHLASNFGLDPALLALVIAPIATELPEKFNSLIWVRQGKDTLAMGNITGAMVFQSCIPTAIGVVLAADAWTLSSDSLLSFASAGIAFISMAVIFLPTIRRGSLSGRHLLLGGIFYAVYLALVVARLGGIW